MRMKRIAILFWIVTMLACSAMLFAADVTSTTEGQEKPTKVGYPDYLACDPCFMPGEPTGLDPKFEVARKVGRPTLLHIKDKNGLKRLVQVRGDYYLIWTKTPDPETGKNKLVATRTSGDCEIIPSPPAKKKEPPPPPPPPKIERIIEEKIVEVPKIEYRDRIVREPARMCAPMIKIEKEGEHDGLAVCADYIVGMDRAAILLGTLRPRQYGAYNIVEPMEWQKRHEHPPCDPKLPKCDPYAGLPWATQEGAPGKYLRVPQWLLDGQDHGKYTLTYLHPPRQYQTLSYAQYGNADWFELMGDISYIYHFSGDGGFLLAFEILQDRSIKPAGNVSLDNLYPNRDFIEGLR